MDPDQKVHRNQGAPHQKSIFVAQQTFLTSSLLRRHLAWTMVVASFFMSVVLQSARILLADAMITFRVQPPSRRSGVEGRAGESVSTTAVGISSLR